MEHFIPSSDDGKLGRGGLYFTSSNGIGYTHSSGSVSVEDGQPIKIDLLISAVGGFPKGNADTEMSPFQYSGNEVNKLAKLIDVLKSDKAFAVKVDKLLGGVKALLGAEKAGEKVGKAIDVLMTKNALDEAEKAAPLMEETKKPNGVCSVCGVDKDSSHINKTARAINEDRKKKAREKKNNE
jgi:hypothetical protein